jgi:hypothetical protein
MFFIPYGNVQIKTKLNREDIESRINDQIISRPVGLGLPRATYKYFEGNIDNVQFKLNRYSSRGNFLTPVLIGKIRQRNGFSMVDITLRLDFLTLGVLLLFLLGSTLPIIFIFLMPLFTPTSSEYLQYIQSQPISDSIQFVLMLFGTIITGLFSLYLFVIIPFNIEAKKVLKYLNELLSKDDLANLYHSS